MTDLKAALAANWDDAERLMALGLPGCLAIGYVPGSKPGKFKPASDKAKLLVATLLAEIRKDEGGLH